MWHPTTDHAAAGNHPGTRPGNRAQTSSATAPHAPGHGVTPDGKTGYRNVARENAATARMFRNSPDAGRKRFVRLGWVIALAAAIARGLGRLLRFRSPPLTVLPRLFSAACLPLSGAAVAPIRAPHRPATRCLDTRRAAITSGPTRRRELPLTSLEQAKTGSGMARALIGRQLGGMLRLGHGSCLLPNGQASRRSPLLRREAFQIRTFQTNPPPPPPQRFPTAIQTPRSGKTWTAILVNR